MALRHVLPQQAIGADHLGPARSGRADHMVMVDHQEMVADPVEGVLVAPDQAQMHRRDGRHLLVEDL